MPFAEMTMPRMRATDVAVLLSRLSEQHPVEIKQLQAHIEAIDAEDMYTKLAKEVGEVVGEQRSFMTTQQAMLASCTEVLQRIADEQHRANNLEERKLKLAEQRMKTLWQPIVAGIVGLIAGGIGTYFTALAGSVGGADK